MLYVKHCELWEVKFLFKVIIPPSVLVSSIYNLHTLDFLKTGHSA